MRTGAAAAIAGGAAWLGWLAWPDVDESKIGQLAAAAVLGTALVAVYIVAFPVLRVTAMSSVQATVRAKLRR